MKTIGTPIFEKRIGNMKLGDKGFVVPWAFEPLSNRLNLDFTVHESRSGTVDLPIERTGKGDTDFTVFLNDMTSYYKF